MQSLPIISAFIKFVLAFMFSWIVIKIRIFSSYIFLRNRYRYFNSCSLKNNKEI